jgi:hypothetical protein
MTTSVFEELQSAAATFNNSGLGRQPRINFVNAVLAAFAATMGMIPAGPDGLPGVLVVSPTGDNATAARGTFKPYQTIQAAVDATLTGDTIYVCEGTYDEQVILKDVDNVTMEGIGSNSSAELITTSPGAALRTTSTINLRSFTLRSMTVGSTLDTPGVVLFGDPSSLMDSVYVDDSTLFNVTFDKVSKVVLRNASVLQKTSFYGVDQVDAEGCLLVNLEDVYNYGSHNYGGKNSRLHQFRSSNVRARSAGDNAVLVQGCPIFDMDGTCTVTGVVDATALDPNAAVGENPMLRFGAKHVPAGAAAVDTALLKIGFTNNAFVAGGTSPGGFDLSRATVYGLTTVDFTFPLSTPINPREVQFVGAGAQLFGGITASGGGSANYLVAFRGSTLCWDEGTLSGVAPPVTATNNVDIDLRTCNIRNCDLSATGNGGIDRDSFSSAVFAVGISGSIPITPPLPSYVGDLTTNSYTPYAALADKTSSLIAFLPGSSRSTMLYECASPAGTFRAALVRSQQA